MGFLYALVAVGLTIIWGLMEMINFAHGEFLMLGMFGAWWASVAFGLDPLLSIVPVGLAMYALGVLVYRQLMRRVQRGDPFTQIFATVGLLFLLQNSAVAVFTSDYRYLSDTLLTRLSGANVNLLGITIGVPLLIGALLALVLFLALYLLIDRTEFGLALRATAEDREAAMLVGIRPQKMFAVAWGLGAALVAVAGAILANFFAVFPQVGFPFTVLAYAIVALGVGWNVSGGWAGQFDFGPQVFFAIGAYTAAILFVHVGLSPWLGMLAGVLAAMGICALVTYPLTRLRGHYFAISTVAIWMIAQPIGATWEFINGSRGLFIPMQGAQGVLGATASLQFAGRTKALGYYYVAFGLLGLTLWLLRLVEHSKLGFYFRAIRDDVTIVLIAALRPTGILSLPWSRWARRLAGRPASGRLVGHG